MKRSWSPKRGAGGKKGNHDEFMEPEKRSRKKKR